MSSSNRVKNQHLLYRAAFGPMAENAATLDTISTQDLWQKIKQTSSKSPTKIEVANNFVDGLMNGVNNLPTTLQTKAENGRLKRIQYRKEIKNLNVLWLNEMINSGAQLREKMSLFWHGHFACRVVNSFFQQELLHTIRSGALGSFSDLLKAVSKSPSMLQFLNNQQNKKGSPNENFAREVMELFTMGRGNYSEVDIKEAARAFTGWGFDLNGQFVFRKRQHDDGAKTFLGRTGDFTGDDILDILLEQPATATFITKKVYSFFVNDNTNKEHINWLSNRFYKNKYDIGLLLEDMFTSNWFFEEENIGKLIKSPIELIVGIRRFLPLELDNDAAQILFQNVLGQVLFYPPNVAGWPGGRSWIDSSTLMVRLQLPQIFSAKDSIQISAKEDDDVNMGMKAEEVLRIRRNKIYADKGGMGEINWMKVIPIFEKISRENLATSIAGTLLQTKNKLPASIMSKYLSLQNREEFIKSAVITVMSTPEYQMA